MSNPQSVDLLVIGGGMTGSVAAAIAAERGLSVVLIRKGYGATALSSGAIDFGREKAGDPLAEEAIAFFARGMAAVGCSYSGKAGETVELLTVLGTVKAAQLYPASTAVGRLGHLARCKALFIGVRGLAEYNAAYVAQAAQALFQGRVGGGQATSCEIEFPGIRHTHSLLGFDLAQLLDEREIAVQFAEIVAAAAQGYSHVALPPIIGLDRAAEAFATLTGVCSAPCFELLSATPSLLGLRLQNALGHWVQKQARIVHGVVGCVERDNRVICAVQVVDRDTEHWIRPRSVLLATGRFIGGGVCYEASFQETVLGLPVWQQDALVAGKSPSDLSAVSFTDEQPFMSVGLRTDEELRPLDENGQVAYENVFAAGALVQGCDYHAGRGSLGTALINGYRVGKRVSERLHEQG